MVRPAVAEAVTRGKGAVEQDEARLDLTQDIEQTRCPGRARAGATTSARNSAEYLQAPAQDSSP